AVGLGAALVFVAADASVRESLMTSGAHDIIILAALMPMIFGIVQAVADLGRAGARTSDIVELFARPPRRDAERRGDAPPSTDGARSSYEKQTFVSSIVAGSVG